MDGFRLRGKSRIIYKMRDVYRDLKILSKVTKVRWVVDIKTCN